MPESLNDLERKVLDYIVGYLRANTYQPSIREIGREFSIKSTKTVSELLQSLADKGWIERDPSRSRGVRLIGLEGHAGSHSVPLVEQDLTPGTTYIEVDRRFAGAAGCFLMTMTGSHLREDCIRPGDLLLVEPVAAGDLVAGDIVVLRAADGPQVRRVAASADGIDLDAAAPGEARLALTSEQAAAVVQGRVSSVLRRLQPVAVHASANSQAIAR